MARLSVPLDTNRIGREAQALEAGLRRRIVGQDEAIRQIVDVYQIYLTGMSAPGRPLGNFLFLGPTGSGKTRTVEAVAESLLGNRRALTKIDCGEFQHSHEIAKLIGSPPGYLGHRETHPMLSQEMLDQYQTDRVKLSFVLFDEVEKASDALWNLLLGILDKATLTLGDTRRVDFSRTMVFMTSNLGAAEMSAMVSPRLGFFVPDGTRAGNGNLAEKMAKAGMEAARRRFTPEFMNRLDKIVVFKPLGERELRAILEIELRMVQERVANSEIAFKFALTQQAKDYVLNVGTDPRYGARPLKRAIERLIVQPMSNLMATAQVHGGDLISIDFDPALSRVVFLKEMEAPAAAALPRRSAAA
ncbi:MAG: AAA family ATPase [Acidobacteria bacterium]|nr:AAA family ATPase [Acidobacteriota bacterium]